jgi:hypothetical protein
MEEQKQATPNNLPLMKRWSDFAAKKRRKFQWQTSLKDFCAS